MPTQRAEGADSSEPAYISICAKQGSHMDRIETDYLIIGAGASGMAFADTLLSETDYEMVLVDRRAQPGGHWVDAYPFVELHQPSAYYGVNSRPLGQDRIDTTGINAGMYERAGAAELQYYYRQVLDESFLPSGRIDFRAACNYLGEQDGEYVIRSNLSGRQTHIAVRRALVDATVTQSTIPSRHTPSFHADPGVCVVTPNELVDIAQPKGFTILGAGKTGMDVCFWLLKQGVAPSEITWIRPRDVWMTDRTYAQPREMSGNMIEMAAAAMQTAAVASSPEDYALRMEAQGMMFRIDPSESAIVNRGATVSRPELASFREIEHIVRKGYVTSISDSKVVLKDGEIGSNPGRVFVDCTAPGLSSTPATTIFEEGKINLFFTTRGVAPWSAALIACVETLDLDLVEKNRLCPPLPRTGDMRGFLNIMRVGLPVEAARRSVSELADWSARARLNPGRDIPQHMNDPKVRAGFKSMMSQFEPAIKNLERICAQT
ncbi:MAG: NAD(P)-binding protein [Pseudomonadota bacterium]